MPVFVSPLAIRRIAAAGVPAVVAYGPFVGGFILNPRDAGEVLFVDPTGPAALQVTETTVAIQPGGNYRFPQNQTSNIWVAAATLGHRFSGFVLQPPVQPVPTPQNGTFPPAGPVTMTELYPAYLYQEYNDDDDLQNFVATYNALAQQYMDWFASGTLPVYTSPSIAGPLLDWVAEGLYGMVRPALSSGRNRDQGPLNTWRYNTIPYNVRRRVGPNNVVATSDDVFKRIMTWNFYKGDGNVFSIRWLKRRVMRFLFGPNGTAPNIDQTYPISITFGPGIISIRLGYGTRLFLGGAIYGGFGFNRMRYNQRNTQFISGPSPPALAPIFKEAIESGALTLPFQYDVIVTVSGG